MSNLEQTGEKVLANVERGGRGGERAAPLAGSLMSTYFEMFGR